MHRFNLHSRRSGSVGRLGRTPLMFALLLSMLFIFSSDAYAQGTSIIQSISTNHYEDPYVVGNLLESGTGKRYYSGTPDENWNGPAYIQIELPEGGLKYNEVADDDCLLVYVRRAEHEDVKHPNDNFRNSHPTVFQVEGQFDGDDTWYQLFYAYFLYRGPYTQEYSSKVLIKKLWKKVYDNPNEEDESILEWEKDKDGNTLENKALLRMRFNVTANNNRETGDNNYREMALARFDVLKIKKDADYSETFRDRLHLNTDYIKGYEDYEFINTQGIVDKHNTVKGWNALTDVEKDKLEDLGISFPDFSFITKENTPEPPIVAGQVRQRTHTVDHIVYAIPGDVVALYPYYEMYNTEHFDQNFSHWYDYRTGKRLTYKAPWSGIEYEMLDFAIDPSHILFSKDHGFFGSQYLNGEGKPRIVNNVQDYIDAVNYINSTDPGCYIELAADLNFGNRTDIPMLGTEANPFTGFFNGAGHTISNLKYDFKDQEGVGLIGRTGNGARIENLIVANTCTFIGNCNVGLVGQHGDNFLYIRNVKTEATCYGVINNEQAAGGIVGKGTGNSNKIIVENCYIGGEIGSTEYPGSNNGAITGWIGTSNVSNNAEQRSTFRNIVVNCTLHNPEGQRYYYRNNPGNGAGEILVDNCFGNQGNGTFQNFTYNNGDSNPLNWANNQPIFEKVADKYKASKGDRKYGTFATFFCPRNPYEEQGNQKELPFITDLDEKEGEYIIAADFSQEFSIDRNLTDLSETTDGKGYIYEPIISSRHLFHIRDGRAFAEDFSGSADANINFIRRNQKMVSARADVPFQIRFDTPVPKDPVSRSNYYYKISDQDYRRVCSMDIEVYDTQGNKVNDLDFVAAESFVSQGTRDIDGVTYRLCGSGAEYYRMLYCEKPKPGNFIVRLIGKDVNGDRIKVFKSNRELVVMEYNISFLSEPNASVVSDDQLYTTYRSVSPETLEELYGEPSVINFDEYMQINDLDNDLKNKLISTSKPDFSQNNFISSFFKWPVKWENSNYSFGYNNRHDYNMYMLATHSGETPFHRAADSFNSNGGNGTGLYDRKFYETLRLHNEDGSKSIEQGYFYYVNAATDPGVSARLRITRLCPGSTLHVSAWMAEFTDFEDNPTRGETANISFNFVAKLKENLPENRTDVKGGDRIVLHSFITGYVPIEKRGEWMHVYYSFVPQLSEFSEHGITAEMVEYYELELDNNCKNSEGADYAIDDIRLYIAKPEVLATQLSPMCGGAAKIRVESPFRTLLQTCGEQEATGKSTGYDVTLLYTFIDKKAFDSKFDLNKTQNDVTYEEAFNYSVVRFDYDGRGEGTSDSDGEKLYGKLSFNTYLFNNKQYSENIDADENDIISVKASRREGDDGRDMIVFTSNLTDNMFSLRKEYYVVLATPFDNQKDIVVTPGSEYLAFDISNDCAKMCVVTVTPSQIVKIDGVIVEEMDKFTVCENQSPVVQVNVWGQKIEGKTSSGVEENPEPEPLAETDQEGDNGPVVVAQNEPDMVELEKNAWFDWYLGPIKDFYNDKDAEGNDKLSIYEALSEFRLANPDARDFDDVKLTDKFTKEMLDLLKGEKKLSLYQSSYVVPPVKLEEDEKSKQVRLVVIPVPVEQDDNIVICTDPTELSLTVENKSPKLQHGLSGITYPMEDVPLRIGLNQLRAEKTDEGASGFDMKLIEIPVRFASSTDKSVQSLNLVSQKIPGGNNEQKGIVLLVGTNDDEYEDLGTIEEKNDKEEDTSHLLWVGEVEKLNASTGVGVTSNLFNVRFKDDFHFKEGYYYRMRFEYSEASAESEVVCNGHDVFTLKIVPEYLVWTGRTMPKDGATAVGSLNWNNDANWSRVESKELFLEDGKASGSHRHFVTDGKENSAAVNNRVKAYAPLDFTHVIIRGSVGTEGEEPLYEAPYLYAAATTSDVAGFAWPENPELPETVSYADFPGADRVGSVTEDIKYDMAARWINKEAADGVTANVGCRPWYMNTCKEIHFKPGATIMNQQELTYERAWVDVELDPQRWYTLASPLQEVYAGDFYLPSTANAASNANAYSGFAARQETELFQPITFEPENNTASRKYNRFMPAVFQRGWDKSSASVYEINSSEVRNVMVTSNWSRVYNDVKEQYGGGVGFSIKSDVSALNESLQPDKVVFRLPKADTNYLYYNQDGSQSGHSTAITRGNGHYKLNPKEGTITATTANAGITAEDGEVGTYFLVGNPFMTYMDIRKFLDINKDKVYQKYWLVTANAQNATTFAGGNPITTEVVEGTDVTIVAPMQGFFVKSKTAATELELNYDASMMRRYSADENKTVLTAPTRSAEEPSMLRITALNNGLVTSSALVATGFGNTDMKSVEAIDNRGLDIPSTVYTVGNGMALSINFIDDAEGLEIGLAADDDTETVIRFEGVDAASGLSLLDKQEYSLTSLYDGLEIELSGAAAGRYFLTRSSGVEEVYDGIEWNVEGNTLTVYDRAASGSLNVKVYDTLGRLSASESTDGDSVRMALGHGVYVVEIANGLERKSVKIRM